MINNIIDNLVTPELSKKEISVYVTLIENGESTVKTLSELTGIKRPTVYLILENLHKKGLASVIEEGKIKNYVAQDPENLKEFFAQKVRVLNNIMPKLKWFSNRLSKKPAVRFFSGIEGARSAYAETLEEPPGTTICSAGSLEDAPKILGEDWSRRYLENRKDKKIKASAILADEPFARELTSNNKKQLRETILVDPKLLPKTTELMFFGNKISFASYRDKPLGIIIENKEFAQILKTLYKLVWDNKNKKHL
jgi:sugar-specific transcriptional regulator TrmB